MLERIMTCASCMQHVWLLLGRLGNYGVLNKIRPTRFVRATDFPYEIMDEITESVMRHRYYCDTNSHPTIP